MLAFSRHQVIEPKVIDLNDLVINTDKMLRPFIEEDIELVILPTTDLEPVKVDPGQMEQVLINLAVNARDAMPAGGKLIVETANVTLDAEYVRQHSEASPGWHVMLAVSDTGMGMSEPTFPIWLKSFLSNSSMVFQPLSNYGPFLRVPSYNNSMICHFAVRCRRHHGGT